jgi:DMSO/TMAO reductase YedYZ molybdopterin-dependent catalytic subunit
MSSRSGFSPWRGAVCGLLAAAVAMGVAQLFAGFTIPSASPVVAVGEVVIDHTPLPVKEWATSTFGTGDKTVLVGGVLVVVFLYSMLVGVLAVRRLALGFAGLAIFAVLGLDAALTRHDATASYAVPTVFGALGGAIALWWLVVTARAAARESSARRGARDPGRLPPVAFQPADPYVTRDYGTREAGQAPGGTRDDAGASRDDAGDEASGWIAGSAAAAEPPAGREPARAEPSRAGPARPEPSRAGPPTSGSFEPWPPSPGSPARRQFLVAAGTTVAAAALGEAVGRSLSESKNVTLAQQAIRLPRAAAPAAALPRGINPPVPGLSSFITPNGQFYRVDTAIVVPEVAPASWSLRIHGMVAREVTITFDQLLRRPLSEDYITLTCVSDPVAGPYIGNAKWLGASLAALIRSAGPQRGADQLLCTSVDGFTSGTPLQVVLDGRDALVAIAMNGTVLPTEHGFPARLVVPGLYGYVSACKWVVDIEVTTFAKAQGYWVPLGWSQQGPIKTESRIDVPANGNSLKAGKVPVAGVAWAQHKGIEAVEARVDNGPWNEATLAAVPGIDTWRQWVWQWDATPGTHLIEARATDKTGYTQTSVTEDVAPNGASGYPSAQVTVS